MNLPPAAELIVFIFGERHPEPMTVPEARARFLELVREHGSIEAALAALKRKRLEAA